MRNTTSNDAGNNHLNVLQLSSPSGKRGHPRVTLPIRVAIGEEVYPVLDWSLGGFGLGKEAPRLRTGDVVKVCLFLPARGFEIAIDGTAKVTRATDGAARGFKFIDTPPDALRALQQAIDGYLDGDLRAITQASEPQGSESQREARHLRWLHRLSAGTKLFAIMSGSLGLAVFGGLAVATSLLTVRSELAAVASGLSMVRAPESGFLEGGQLALNDQVARGQVIAEVQPSVTPQAIVDLKSRLEKLHTTLKLKREALAESQVALDDHRERLLEEAQALEARRAVLAEQIAVQQALYDRLAGSNAIARLRIDDEHLKLLALQEKLAALDRESVRLSHAILTASRGDYATNGSNRRDTPDIIKRRIEEIEAEIAAGQASLAALEEHFLVRSPCDCSVEQVQARIGEFVERGQAVYALGTRTTTDSEVDVLVPSEKVRFLNVGMKATAVLADSIDEVPVRIRSINFNPETTGRTGLPDNLRRLGRYALVTVAIDDPARRPQTGLPAIVSFRIPLGTLLYDLTGIGWMLDGGDDFAAEGNKSEPARSS